MRRPGSMPSGSTVTRSPSRRSAGQIGKGGDQLMPVFLSKADIDRIGGELGGPSRRHPQGALPPPHQGLPRGPRAVPAPDRGRQADRPCFFGQGRRIGAVQEDRQSSILIDAETSSDDAEKSKPHPDIFQAALARLADKSPARTIVVGDTPYDAEAAAKAGLRTIGLLSGGWSEEELRRAGCMAVFKDPADLLARYSQSPLGANAGPDAL